MPYTKEKAKAYGKQWAKNNPDKVAEYNRKAYVKRKFKKISDVRYQRQRATQISPKEARQLFDESAIYTENKITHSGFMGLDAIKIAKMDFGKLEIVGLK